MAISNELPELMQAIDVGPEKQLVFVNLPVPQPAAGEVLIKVDAAGVNRADLAQRGGYYPAPPGESPILGLEVSGTVVAVGDLQHQDRLGQQVYGLVPGGGYAEYVKMPVDHLMVRPDVLSPVQAAGCAEVFLTAFQALFLLGELQPGQWVLLHAGASGVGTAAIQLAKKAGAYVAVTVGSDEKAAACLQLGADLAVNYKTTDYVVQFKQHVPQGFQVVIDPVAGEYIPKNLQVLGLDGRIIVLAMLGGRTVPSFDLTQMFKKRGQLLCSTLRNRTDDYKTALVQRFVGRFGQNLATGDVKPVIARVLPWQQAEQAHQLLADNALVGKVVLQLT